MKLMIGVQILTALRGMVNPSSSEGLQQSLKQILPRYLKTRSQGV